ncbi:MAG: peptidylprolyl isomerase [Acidobacteria bacterium]|nr:peptidylprolyl isomerase [Acidobacteriota bacterium]
MFDLFRSRQKTTRYLLGALLGAVALSMVVTLIPGFGSSTGTGSSTDQVIAEIGKQTVTYRDIQLALQEQIKNRNIPTELVSVYAPQIVNSLVAEYATAYIADQLGYKPTDEDVATTIQMMVPQLFEGGKFVGKEAYSQFLAANNTSIAEFEQKARMSAAKRRVTDVILEGMLVTPEEIEKEYKSRNEVASIEYVKIDPAKLSAEIKVTPDEINAHWATSKSNYRVPEKRAFRVLYIDEAKVGENMKLGDDDLRKLYSSNLESFRTPERVHARHILVKAKKDDKDDEAKAKAKAEDVLKQLKAGGDFAELAKKNSDDTGSAVKGGDLDFFGRGQMVKPFEDSAFSLKLNEISGVVQSDFGYHIIQTLAKEEARLKPFEEVKAKLAVDAVKQMAYDKMQEAIDKARPEVVKNPEAAEEIAKKWGLAYLKVDRAGRGEPVAQIGTNADVDDAVFDLKKKGEVTNPVTTQGNKLILAVLDEIFPARQAELNEVESQIRQNITNERTQRMLTDRSREIVEKVKAAGGDLRKVVAGYKLEIKTANEFSRASQVEGIGASSYFEEAFLLNVGGVFGPVNINNSNYICKVTAKKPADMAKFNEQKFDILLRLKGRKAQERKDLFEDGLVQFLKQKGIVKIHQDTLKRLMDSYKNS